MANRRTSPVLVPLSETPPGTATTERWMRTLWPARSTSSHRSPQIFTPATPSPREDGEEGSPIRIVGENVFYQLADVGRRRWRELLRPKGWEVDAFGGYETGESTLVSPGHGLPERPVELPDRGTGLAGDEEVGVEILDVMGS